MRADRPFPGARPSGPVRRITAGAAPRSPGRGPRRRLSDHRTVGPVGRDEEIPDAAWAVIAPLPPPAGRARGRWRDHRQVLEDIVFEFRTGLPWRDLPERFGPWQTVHGRFARRAADGTFDRLLTAARSRAEVDRLVAIDSTIVRAHQHAAAEGGSKNAARDAPTAG
ncbi:transposase [Streptomyces sp. NPDC055632]